MFGRRPETLIDIVIKRNREKENLQRDILNLVAEHANLSLEQINVLLLGYVERYVSVLQNRLPIEGQHPSVFEFERGDVIRLLQSLFSKTDIELGDLFGSNPSNQLSSNSSAELDDSFDFYALNQRRYITLPEDDQAVLNRANQLYKEGNILLAINMLLLMGLCGGYRCMMQASEYVFLYLMLPENNDQKAEYVKKIIEAAGNLVTFAKKDDYYKYFYFFYLDLLLKHENQTFFKEQIKPTIISHLTEIHSVVQNLITNRYPQVEITFGDLKEAISSNQSFLLDSITSFVFFSVNSHEGADDVVPDLINKVYDARTDVSIYRDFFFQLMSKSGQLADKEKSSFSDFTNYSVQSFLTVILCVYRIKMLLNEDVFGDDFPAQFMLLQGADFSDEDFSKAVLGTLNEANRIDYDSWRSFGTKLTGAVSNVYKDAFYSSCISFIGQSLLEEYAAPVVSTENEEKGDLNQETNHGVSIVDFSLLLENDLTDLINAYILSQDNSIVRAKLIVVLERKKQPTVVESKMLSLLNDEDRKASIVGDILDTIVKALMKADKDKEDSQPNLSKETKLFSELYQHPETQKTVFSQYISDLNWDLMQQLNCVEKLSNAVKDKKVTTQIAVLQNFHESLNRLVQAKNNKISWGSWASPSKETLSLHSKTPPRK